MGLVYFIFKSNKKSIKNSEKINEENEFIQCDKCKTFVLKKEAIKKDEKYYCKECNANS
jgi:uncharacterized protein